MYWLAGDIPKTLVNNMSSLINRMSRTLRAFPPISVLAQNEKRSSQTCGRRQCQHFSEGVRSGYSGG